MDTTWQRWSVVVTLVTTLVGSCANATELPDIQLFTQARQEIVRKRAELIRAKARARFIIAAAERKDPPVGVGLRQELATRVDALKVLLSSGKTDEINSATAEVESRVSLIGSVHGRLASVEEKLGPMAKDLSPALVAPVEQDLEEHRGFFMTNHDDSSMLYMREAARATSAAPTYFPPAQMAIPPRPLKLRAARPNPSTETINHISLLDGGVYANNPAAYGLTQIRSDEDLYRTGRTGPERPWLLLSLGTGQLPPSVPFSDPRSWGLVKWAGPLVDIMFSNAGPDVRDIGGLSGFYSFRLQPETLTADTEELDGSDPAKIAALKETAIKYIQAEEESLKKITALLKRERPAECQREPASIEIR